jgi:hypothetical protein
MICEEASVLLPQLLAGTLNGDAEQEALHHLARCEGCRKELAFWAKVSKAVRAEAAEMPAELFDGILEELLGERPVAVLESLRLAGRALGLAGSACRLAFSAAGMSA